MATHYNILAYSCPRGQSPWTEEPGRLKSMGSQRVRNDWATKHSSVHCSTVYNSQNMEATLMPINREMGKEDVVQIYNVMLLSHRKEQNSAIRSNMDGPWYCHMKWSKSDRERQMHMISLKCRIVKKKKNGTNELIYKQEKSHNVENNFMVPGGRMEGWIVTLGSTCTH